MEKTDKKNGLDIIRLFLYSLNPDKYKILLNIPLKKTIKFFTLLVFLSSILMIVLSIPSLTPSAINKKFDAFNKLNINLSVSMNQPLMLPSSESPLITIDTTGNITKLGKSKVLITDKLISYRTTLLGSRSLNTSEFSDLLSKRHIISRILTVAVIIILPMVLLLIFMLSLIKYALIGALALFISYAYLKIKKTKISIKQTFNLVFYSLTIMVLIESISTPFSFKKYLVFINIFYGIGVLIIPLILFIIMLTINILIIQNRNIKLP